MPAAALDWSDECIRSSRCLWGCSLKESGPLLYLSIWYRETRLSVAMVSLGVLARAHEMAANSAAFTFEVGQGLRVRSACEREDPSL